MVFLKFRKIHRKTPVPGSLSFKSVYPSLSANLEHMGNLQLY